MQVILSLKLPAFSVVDNVFMRYRGITLLGNTPATFAVIARERTFTFVYLLPVHFVDLQRCMSSDYNRYLLYGMRINCGLPRASLENCLLQNKFRADLHKGIREEDGT